MTATQRETERPTPFLLPYAVPRTPSTEIPGYYSQQHEMWVVNSDGVEEPLIEKDMQTMALVTKTMTQQEADDHPSLLYTSQDKGKNTNLKGNKVNPTAVVFEMATKTEAQLERDDSSISLTELFI